MSSCVERDRCGFKRDVLYIVDAINYAGGAHVATARLVKALAADGCAIDVLATEEPKPRTIERFGGARILVAESRPVSGWRWFLRGVMARCGFHISPPCVVDPDGSLRKLMCAYKCVCVMSEMSRFSWLVAGLPAAIRKVQLFHVDYAFWSRRTDGGRLFGRYASLYYSKMDELSVVGEANAEKLRRQHPAWGKITSFRNLIPVPLRAGCRRAAPHDPVRLVTIARMDAEQKDVLRALRVARDLAARGVSFVWRFVGDGPCCEQARRFVAENGLAETVRLVDWRDDVSREFAEADLMILLSHYEGLPNVVYESMLSGVPVFATDVGAVRDQIADGRTGWVVPDVDAVIVERLAAVLTSRQELAAAMAGVSDYHYDNDKVLSEHRRMLGIEEKGLQNGDH